LGSKDVPPDKFETFEMAANRQGTLAELPRFLNVLSSRRAQG